MSEQVEVEMRWMALLLACSCGALRGPMRSVLVPTPPRRTVQVEVRAVGVGPSGVAAQLEAQAWLWPGSEPSPEPRAGGCGVVAPPKRSARPVAALKVKAGQPLPLAWNRSAGRYEGAARAAALDPSWRDVGVELPIAGPVPIAVRHAVHFGGAVTDVAVERSGLDVVVGWAPTEPDTRVALEVHGPEGRVRCEGPGREARLPARLLDAPGARLLLVSRRASDTLLPGGTLLRVHAVWERPLGLPPG